MAKGASGIGIGDKNSSLNPNDISKVEDLFAFKDKKPLEVAAVAKVAQDLQKKYGIVTVSNLQVATLKGAGASVLGFCDSANVAINKKFFNNDKINGAYDACVDSKFHPGRGNKSAMEAVAAHEFGHLMTQKCADKLGLNGLDAGAVEIISRAKPLGLKNAKKISSYATYNSHEAIAEAFADVYCNGNKANSNSKAIVKAMDSILL